MNLMHLGPVAALSNQLGYPCSVADLSYRFKLLNANPQQAMIIATEGDKVLGWIHLEAVLDLIEEVKVEIKALIVDENARGKGIGRELVKSAREWAKTNQISTIYLSCNIIREKAHAFYLKEGFQNVKTSHFFELKI
jgi:GNAT superfamily N-acetyltransferase